MKSIISQTNLAIEENCGVMLNSFGEWIFVDEKSSQQTPSLRPHAASEDYDSEIHDLPRRSLSLGDVPDNSVNVSEKKKKHKKKNKKIVRTELVKKVSWGSVEQVS
jgi:hypothetical protein